MTQKAKPTKPAQVARKRGRPSTYSLAVAERICARIANGETLRAICRDDDMPSWQTVYLWIRTRPQFNELIACARETGFDAIAEESLAITDAPPERIQDAGSSRVDAGYVAWQKNRAEHRLKLLAKWSPKKYGDRMAVDADVHQSVVVVSDFPEPV